MPDPIDDMPPSRRQALLAVLASLAGQRHRGAAGRDRALLDACACFNAIERQRVALIEGPHQIEDDDERDCALAQLEAGQMPFLDQVCGSRASTLIGHRARAISFVLFDGGEVARRARVYRTLEDRLLEALLRDLVGREVSA